MPYISIQKKFSLIPKNSQLNLLIVKTVGLKLHYQMLYEVLTMSKRKKNEDDAIEKEKKPLTRVGCFVYESGFFLNKNQTLMHPKA